MGIFSFLFKRHPTFDENGKIILDKKAQELLDAGCHYREKPEEKMYRVYLNEKGPSLMGFEEEDGKYFYDGDEISKKKYEMFTSVIRRFSYYDCLEHEFYHDYRVLMLLDGVDIKKIKEEYNPKYDPKSMDYEGWDKLL
jgi:hypothetical protein